MQGKVNVNALLEAAKSHLISFDNFPSAPVLVDTILDASRKSIAEIADRYFKFGFAVIHINSETPSPGTVVAIGNLYNLGEPFTPPLYSKGGYKTSPISKISTQGYSASHPTFQGDGMVQLHCDGTLQKIGFIKTSVIVCEMQGANGGDSILFNATGAYAELIERDLDAAIAMATHGSLVRQANINGCSDKNIGPVFSVYDGKIICNYSVTATDKFLATSRINAAALARGVEYMRKASQPGSPYYGEVRLEANQAIMLANTKLAHGRKPYQNAEGFRRCLYRGLFLSYPRIAKQEELKIAV